MFDEAKAEGPARVTPKLICDGDFSGISGEVHRCLAKPHWVEFSTNRWSNARSGGSDGGC